MHRLWKIQIMHDNRDNLFFNSELKKKLSILFPSHSSLSSLEKRVYVRMYNEVKELNLLQIILRLHNITIIIIIIILAQHNKHKLRAVIFFMLNST